jgi:hypothetical protein
MLNDNQKSELRILGLSVLMVAVITLPFWAVWISASNEAAAFNRFTTGPKATAWDALWIELRVQADQ